MPKIFYAKSKPKQIQVVKVEDINSHPELKQDTEGDLLKVYNKPQLSWINVHVGDYLRVDDPNDLYPISEDYFNKNYDLITTGN